ncbi:hypothetical protein GCM10010278_71800 [Streptomyces melanogenes]|nr:hypothetical protein GCM10010278_71800 [Streptomyces melanogenes]
MRHPLTDVGRRPLPQAGTRERREPPRHPRRSPIVSGRNRAGQGRLEHDNALAESFFQSLKHELLHGRRWTSKAQTRLELFRWLSYDNRRRHHSALGCLTPTEFEQQLTTSHTLPLVA